MVAIAFVSVKGAPGVTTAAAAIAAVSAGPGAPRRPVPGATGAVLAELDPSGGSLQVMTQSPASWGLVDAAGRLRRQVTADAVLHHLTVAPPGVAALTAPPAGHVAAAVIGSAGERWVPALRAAAPEVVVDAGRWAIDQPTSGRIRGADLVAVVCRPTVAGLETARLALDRVREAARAPVAVVLVGRKPYGPDEIAAQLDVPVGGVLAWDPRGVAALWATGATRRWWRSSLARSARQTRTALASLADRGPAPAGDRQPAGAAPGRVPSTVPASSANGHRPPVPGTVAAGSSGVAP